MIKKLLIFTCVFCSCAIAEEQIEMYASDSADIELSPLEEMALHVAQEEKDKRYVPITAGNNGYIRYVYGAQTPSVICAPMRICDIKLQIGEVVNSLHLGDTARWEIQSAIEGAGSYATQHLILKPFDVNVKTNLVVSTNRRIYHIDLVATKEKWMPQISFVYPEDAIAKFKAQQNLIAQEKEKNTIPETGEYLGNLDFKYEIDGDEVIWKPVRVYNDRTKTIIELADSVNANEAPTFIVTKFNPQSQSKEQLVNYRFINNKYIVDAVFYEGILIAGVGSDQDKVIIRREVN